MSLVLQAKQLNLCFSSLPPFLLSLYIEFMMSIAVDLLGYLILVYFSLLTMLPLSIFFFL